MIAPTNDAETLAVMVRHFDGAEGIEWVKFDPTSYQDYEK
jgi:hypothetical protein